MTTGYKVNGIDLASIFGAKGTHTAAATGYKTNGTDLNAQLLALADGVDIGFNTNYKVGNTDLRYIFGKLSGSLPINGQTFTAIDHNSGTTNAAQLYFQTNNSAWSVVDLYGGTQASGSIPSGATSVIFSYSQVSGSNGVSNGASSWTTLTGSNLSLVSSASNVGSGAPAAGGIISVTIQYRNSVGTVISSTTCQFDVEVPAIP